MDNVGEFQVVPHDAVSEVKDTPVSCRWQLPKRVFDVVMSLAGLFVLSPLLLATAVMVALLDGRPVLFLQERIGLNGKPFTLCKFRSMRASNEDSPQITADGDQRITNLGHWLRKLKLDELPQLWNVLIGEMSFVGPRPEVAKYVDLYDKDQQRVLQLMPGITDPASLKYFDESERLATADDAHEMYVQTIMPDKIRINLEYGAKASLLSDVGVILKTVRRVFVSEPES